MVKLPYLISLLVAAIGNSFVIAAPFTSQQLPLKAARILPHQSAVQELLSSSSPSFSLQHEEEIKFHINGIPFFSPNLPAASLASHSFGGLSITSAYTPVTVISVPSLDHFTALNLSDILREYLDADDVLTTDWLSTIILKVDVNDSSPINLAAAEVAWLREHFGIERIHVESSSHFSRTFGKAAQPQDKTSGKDGMAWSPSISGPFLAVREPSGYVNLLPVYGLHSDIYRTFTVGIYPTLSGSYKELRWVDAQGYNLIPVPSRLYSKCAEDSGICGARIGVKDIYDVAGVTTSAGSRAWGEFAGKAAQSASSVQRLVDMGGFLVGKTKTASFAVGSLGHEETVDEQYPFSARGDLWQSCVGSSSGSACAMGAYDWLDFALGSDTGGSVRGPAAVVGLYGNRPSHGALPLDGVVPLVDYSDTAGFLVRDPEKFSTVMRSWYVDSPLKFEKFPRIPSRIILDVDFGQNHTSPAFNVTNHFLDQVKETLGIGIARMDIDELFTASNWSWSELESMTSSQSWCTWNRNGRRLYESYADHHDGRSPPTDPHIRDFWKKARDQNITREDYEAILSNLSDFSALVNDQLLGNDEASCSRNILIYDIGTGGRPLYREKDLNKDPRNVTNGNQDQKLRELGPLAGCVDVTIPIGQVPYMSNISEHEEMAPVTVSVVARKGCDFMIADFVDRLAKAGLIGTVKTGRTPF